MNEIDDEIRQAFFDDAVQLIETSESLLMAMDSGQNAPDAIDTLFRAAHNLKGSAMTMGYDHLSRVAHVYEDALTLLKRGHAQASPQFCDVLLRAVDFLKAFIEGLKGNQNFQTDSKAIEKELVGLASLKQTAVTAEPVVEHVQPEIQIGKIIEKAEKAEKAPPSTAQAAAKAPAGLSAEDLIRVSTGKLDLLLNFVGELVINQSIMSRHKVEGTADSEHSLQTISYMEKLVNEIQDVAMGLRMTNVRGLFQKMQRTVRDVSATQKKDVNFITEGEHVELDRTIIERMNDPLTHLIRNAVDHGIESQEQRVAAGKPPKAVVKLSAEQQDDTVLITIRDDGKGMDAARLVAKAIEKGILAPGAQLSNHDAYSLIFRPGFSTKEQVTDISGRGVGMDVVARAVEDMKGTIRVETELGKGSAFIISLPLSLSIINGMVVGINAKKFVIPVSQLVETLEYRKFKIESSTRDGRMINLRGEVIPVVALDALLGTPRDKNTKVDTGPGVVTSTGGRKISFEVDELFGQQQVVIKKLGPKMENLPGIIGGAILSNGEPSLVLDLNDLSDVLRRSHAA